MKSTRAVLSVASKVIAKYEPYTVTTYARPELVFERAKGSLMWDSNNKRYIDFMAGIAVTSLGHCDPDIAEIMHDQASTLVHSSNLYYNKWTLSIARELVETTKASGGMTHASRVFLANSGTEANEAALKFARKWGHVKGSNKSEIVSFNGSFHGRTMGALSATPNPKYQAPFSPLVPGFKYGNINDIAALDTLVTDRTCGVIIEPIQGEGGVNVCDTAFLKALRARCDEVGALLIFDEIQCGLGRTGRLWAHQITGVMPDVLTMAKALGNGYPVGAVMVTEDVENVLKVGDHGTTYGGNPLGARIASYVLSRLSDPSLLSEVERKSSIFTDRFDHWVERFPYMVSGYRGRGLMLGVQMTKDPAPIVANALDRGLLVITCGGNTLRFVPALTISDSYIEEGLDILEECIKID